MVCWITLIETFVVIGSPVKLSISSNFNPCVYIHLVIAKKKYVWHICFGKIVLETRGGKRGLLAEDCVAGLWRVDQRRMIK